MRARAIHLSKILFCSAAVSLAMGGCGAMQKLGLGGSKPVSAELTGAQEVPPVSTRATGQSTITVASDRTVSGSVIVADIPATAAHIHQGASGANGPIIIPLVKTADRTFSVPANTRLTDAQYSAFKEGNLYVNVHSAAHPGGEIRVQLKP
ncbi:CHRD domain-containing protein [Noviherbaspirillum humi]|uniref:CHRD domain-containing protein n=1 Tax=Noviherbaspirillum humi TaxID=1688639 RepID=A0A239LWF1_9BURK|nr:CHRD domain-containing protein [Noviherbaspirillum humi]SNT34987.1 CHRD domain-containing protein [Noviherbaspirillum humi]